ncbi:MAG TPA: alpha/beta fold hydrolase [Candidatus Woesebacteria bacterium]|nr:alpha/beta fold hydrolase [Candidatus Woesebacteria bacterium]
MLKKILLIGCLFVFYLSFAPETNAIEKETIVFEDNFYNGIDSNVWQVNNIGGNVTFDDNGLNLTSESSNNFPFVYTRNNYIPQIGDYYIEVKYLFPEITDFGIGFGIGNVIPEYDVIDQTVIDSDFIQFQLWQGSNDGHLLQTNRCQELEYCDSFRTTIFQESSSLVEHVLKIEYRGNDFKIFKDGIEYYDNSLLSINRRSTYFWIGNNVRLSTPHDWTDINIKYIKIVKIEDIQEVYKTIVIPGLGASWDFKALLTGTDGNSWNIPGFVNNYDGLIGSFENAGYTEANHNLFVFPYDWRKPLADIATKLNSYIEANIPSGEKTNLVGHSMGGLVARSYAQTYGTTKINKIITIGSPNMGSVKAYPVWEGGMLMDESWWGKTALALTTHFGVIVGESNIQSIQRLVPSLKDLLPTYDYLVMNGQIVPWETMKSKNDYLRNLNLNIESINSLTTAMYSKDISTDAKINVIPHRVGDLDTWVDGKPTKNPFIKEAGDGTVIETSAKGPFSNLLEGNGWHGELVTKVDNIQKVFGVLGIDQSKAVSGEYDNRKNALIVALKSPGRLDICNVELSLCNDQLGLYFPENKLFIFPGYDGQNLVVTVSEDGERGKYGLHLGDIDNKTTWKVVGGDLKRSGQIDSYVVKDAKGKISLYPSPANENECRRERWRIFEPLRFRNQGECIKYVEKIRRPHSRPFWWHR